MMAFPIVIILPVLAVISAVIGAVPFIGTFLTTGDIALAFETAMNFLDKFQLNQNYIYSL